MRSGSLAARFPPERALTARGGVAVKGGAQLRVLCASPHVLLAVQALRAVPVHKFDARVCTGRGA